MALGLVEVLALQGEIADATALFTEVAGLANDVGLLAEEYDVAHREMLGNFPQAFTHLGLIAAAARLKAAGADDTIVSSRDPDRV